MSIDVLQEKIRKTKNPSVLELSMREGCVPAAMEQDDFLSGCSLYFKELLVKLEGRIPSVRFGFASFSVRGSRAMDILSELMKLAADLGYYVILDAPEILSVWEAETVARALLSNDSVFPCDGLVISAYPGSDIWKPFLSYCKNQDKDIFVCVRTGNKSAPELQDLLAGGRLVHVAAADHVNRYSTDCIGKSGYSNVGVMAAASSSEGLRLLRSKYSRLFLLVDGYDYPHANAKNCAAAFDKFGHGAVVYR